MFGPADTDDYISAVRQTGRRTPIVRVTLFPRDLRSASQGDFLSYSIIPIDGRGRLAVDGGSTEFVAMPHVFARTRDGCGQWNTPSAKRAKLTSNGFANDPDRRASAEALLGRIIAEYGLPGSSTPNSEPDERPTGSRPPPTEPDPIEGTAPEVVEAEAEGAADRGGSDQDETPSTFFDRIRGQVDAAFLRSDVYQRQRELNESWAYSICALPLRPGQPLLLGLNWGADRATRHTAQSRMPGPSEYRSVASYAFISRSAALLRRYLGEIDELNYLNALPFRSPSLEELTAKDWRIGVDSFFLETIDYLHPPLTLILGTTAVTQLDRYMRIEYQTVTVVAGKRVNSHVGYIHGTRTKHRFVALPHPNNRLGNDVRAAIWEKTFAATREVA